MTKREFTKKYKALTAAQKAEIKTYYTDLMKGAHFVETFDLAEKCLLWIREIES